MDAENGYGRPYPRPLFRAHFIQLTLHDVKLPPEYNGGYNFENYERAYENPDSECPPRHHPLVEWALSGVFLSAAARGGFRSV